MALYLRKATPADVDILYEWVNDTDVRESAFNSGHIAYEDHLLWFNKMIKDSGEAQYIFMSDDKPIGQIRLSINDTEAEIDYSISKFVRGYGYGKEIIRLLMQKTIEDFPTVKKLIGKVKPSNVASYYCFEKNGFKEKYQQLEFDLTTDKQASEQIVSGGGLNILFLTNNRNALGLFEWISERCNAEIYSDRLTADYLSAIKPELVVSYNYIYIVSQKCIDIVSGNIINMHISLLPWNRGFSPNIWSFIDGTPKGVTIHMLSAGLDEGDILFQKEVPFNPVEETFETTHIKLNNEIVALFKEHWKEIMSRDYDTLRRKQDGKGSYHTIADLKKLKNKIPFEWSENVDAFLKRYSLLQGRDSNEVCCGHDKVMEYYKLL